MGAQVAEALAHAHGQGILHRDVKPSNLLLDAHGTVWVTDFGLAKASDSSDLTGTGEVVGTLRYIPPERFGGASDACGDVYSLGLTLYEMLTLRPAFDAEDRVRLIEQILHCDPPPPRAISAEVPRDLETVVLKALARDPAFRYQTAAALADDLRRFADDRPILARRLGMPERFGRWCWRNPVVAGLLLTVLLCLSLGAAVATFFAVQAGRQAEEASQREAGERAAKERVRRLLYAAKMNLVQNALRDTKPDLARRLLAELKPGDGEEDLRHFEWHYLWRQLHGEVRSHKFSTGQGGPTLDQCRFSADGRRVAFLTTQGTGNLSPFTPFSQPPWPGRVGSMVWDTAGVRELLATAAEEDEDVRKVRGFAVSPDGRWVAFGKEKESFTVWDVEGRRIRLKERVGGSVVALVFDPAGSRLAAFQSTGPFVSLPLEGSITVWDLDSGRQVGKVEKARCSPDSVCFTPDGRGLFLGGELWDLTTGQSRFQLPPPANSSDIARISPDGRWLALAGSLSKLAVWEGDPWAPTSYALPDLEGVMAMAFSPDSRFLALGQRTETGMAVTLVPLREPPFRAPLSLTLGWHGSGGPFDYPDLVFSPDGRHILSQSAGEMKEWVVPDWVRDQVPPVVRFSADASRVAGTYAVNAYRSGPGVLASPSLGEVSVRGPDGERNLVLHHLPGISMRNIDLSADGRRLAVSWQGTRVYPGQNFVDLRGGPEPGPWHAAEAAQLALGSALDGPAGAPSLAARAAFVCETADDCAEVLDAATGRVLLTARGVTGPVRPSPDGRYLVDGSAWTGDPAFNARSEPDEALPREGTGKVWDVDTGREIARVRPAWADVCLTTFSPDGRRLAVCSASSDRGELGLWDLSTGRPEFTTRLAPGTVGSPRTIVFSPDGRRLACVAAEPAAAVQNAGQGKMMVWNLDGTPTAILEKPTALTLSLAFGGSKVPLAFGPDGTLLAGTLDGRSITLWDLATGQERVSLLGHAGNVVHLAFSPDGRRLLSAGTRPNRMSGLLDLPPLETALEGKVWDLATGQEVLSLPVGLPIHFDGRRIVSLSNGRLRVYDGRPTE
jgi:WD40 repeat protein